MEPLLACSGLGAEALIDRALWLGWVAAAVAGVAAVALAVTSWRAGHRARALVVLGALGVHPGWWVSASQGDCGQERVLLAGLITGTLLGVGAVELLMTRRPALREQRRTWLIAFVVAAVCTVGLDALRRGSIN